MIESWMSIGLSVLPHSSGNTGVAVMLYDPRRSNTSKIERECGVKFEHVSAPQPADIAEAAGVEAAEKISQISDRFVCFLSKFLWMYFNPGLCIYTYAKLQCYSSIQGCCSGATEQL